MAEEIKDAGDIYNKICQFIFDNLPEGFKEAWIHVEMIDDVGGIEVFFKKSDGKIGYINDGIDFIFSEFSKLRKILKTKGQDPWSTVTFYMASSGQMNIDIGYEDVSDFGYAPERRDIWIKKYLGENPAIDWS